MILRYEDFVRNPVEWGRVVYEFCDLDFDHRALSVDLINPSEDPYRRSGQRRGIIDEKVFHFDRHLSQTEQAFVAAVSHRDLVREHYPELAPQLERASAIDRALMLPTFASGLGHAMTDFIHRMRREPSVTLERFWRRLKV
jgi:hypothetical protein